MFVERADEWIGGGLCTEGVTLADEGFGGVGEVGDAVGDVAAGDMFPGGCSKDFPEHLLPGTTKERSPSKL